MKNWYWMLALLFAPCLTVTAAEAQSVGLRANRSTVTVEVPASFEPDAKVFRFELLGSNGRSRVGWNCDEPDERGSFVCNRRRAILDCPYGAQERRPERVGTLLPCVSGSPLQIRIEASDVEPETEWGPAPGGAYVQRLVRAGEWRTVFVGTVNCRPVSMSSDGLQWRAECETR